MDFPYVVVPVLIVLIGATTTLLTARRIRSLRTKSYPAQRKIAEHILLSLAAVAGVALAGSSGFNTIVQYSVRYPPPGQMYLVNGHRMRLHCEGNGSPVILLDAGGGSDGLIWGGVQPGLAKSTRVCSYDRAGMGWSDALPSPRDADHIASELHGLLTVARVPGPIVLMGASRAGIYIRNYATRYPTEVAGLIFVDGSTPLQQLNPAIKAYDGKRHIGRFTLLLNEAVFSAGIPRLFGACRNDFPGFDPRASKLLAEDECHQEFEADAREQDSLIQSGEETVHTSAYGALPILIFSQDPAKAAAEGIPVDVIKAWDQMQEDLKKLSTRSRRIIAKGSGHFIELKRRDLIEKEVPLFVEQIRGTAPQPTDYGSTIAE